MDVAYLYKSTDASVGWTCSIPWNVDRLMDLKNCPVSGEPVGMICDGLVAVAMAEKALAKGGDKDDGDNETEGTMGVVRFKYGKKTYQLSTATGKSATTHKSVSSQSSSGTRYAWLGSWFGIGAALSNVHNTTKEVLAQDRIAEALELDTLKILHKGSLLLDSRQSASETSAQLSVSRTLLKISNDDWKSGSQKKKATLVVMGTRRDHRLEEPPSKDETSVGRSKGLLWIPFRIVYWPCKLALQFVLSFFGPFLPSHMVPGALDSGDREFRPHHD